MSTTHEHILRLRAHSSAQTLETISVLFAVIFANLLLPAVLLKYVYDPANLFEQPAILEMLPIIGFFIGAAHLLYTLLGNFSRARKARGLEHSLTATARPRAMGTLSDVAALAESLSAASSEQKTSSKPKAAAKKTAKTTTRKKRTTKK